MRSTSPSNSSTLSGVRSAACGSTVICGIERRNFSRGSNRFRQRFGGVGFVEQHLPLQVAGLDVIAVDDAKVSHAGARQQRSQRRAGGAATDDNDASLSEFGFTLRANLLEQYLPRVTAFVRQSLAPRSLDTKALRSKAITS